MFRSKTHNAAASVVTLVACLAAAPCASAASLSRLPGAITGVVSDSAGVPQMGAIVVLYNRLDRAFEKVMTDAHGGFRFADLTPDTYSVRVTLATFVPAFKEHILVQPGMRSLLNVNLSALFSTIQLSYPPLENGNLMTDDWKWVLRSASTTRPVLRFAQRADPVQDPAQRTAVFSDTRGILKMSAGEGGLASGVGNEADLGTAFALATSFYGNNLLQVSGNLGYGSQTGVPAAAFRTSYSRGSGLLSGPEVSLTMRQLFLPARMSAAMTGGESSLPMLRTMSAAFDDRVDLSTDVVLQYGFTMDDVSFLDHLNYFSPYARLNYSLGDGAELEFAFTSGNARPDMAGSQSGDSDLQRDLNTLGLFPNVSLRGGRSRIQRGEEYEMAYSRKVGSRTYRLSAYREAVTNAAITVVAPSGLYSGGDILPDLFSVSSIFNAGDNRTSGFTAAVAQSLGEHVTATLMYGSLGTLSVADRELVSNSPDELRSMIRAGRKQAASARIAATSPRSGTHMIASYQWTNDHRAVMPGNLYTTEAFRPMPGLNIYIRQPIPGPAFLPWRMEATADFRNMLAQGYLPLGMAGGQRLLLVETPRTFRGGLSFIF